MIVHFPQLDAGFSRFFHFEFDDSFDGNGKFPGGMVLLEEFSRFLAQPVIREIRRYELHSQDLRIFSTILSRLSGVICEPRRVRKRIGSFSTTSSSESKS